MIKVEVRSKMDPALKAQWVEALRSGKYKQGPTYFERGGKYCCLGVLCVIAERQTELSPAQDNWPFVEEQLPEGGALADLIQMNDDAEKPFPEIADYIEANL